MVNDYAFTIQEGMNILVFDIGGTGFRVGMYNDSVLVGISIMESPSFLKFPDKRIEELQFLLIKYINEKIEEYERKYSIQAICIAFPGIVLANGIVDKAATLWGKEKRKIDLKKSIKFDNKLVYVINDVTAAGYYILKHKSEDTFCVITISSGVGNKVFYKGNVILNNGYGGEIGHINIGHSLEDDSGEIGHLGAIASGRGSVKLAKFLLSRGEYTSSPLYKEEINEKNIVKYFKLKDPLAFKIINTGAQELAKIINIHINSIGIKKYFIIGGFAIALGEKYKKLLIQHLKMLRPYMLSVYEIENSIEILQNDCFSCLEGAGCYVNFIENV